MGRENGLWDYLGHGRRLECTALRYPNIVMFIVAFCVPVCYVKPNFKNLQLKVVWPLTV